MSRNGSGTYTLPAGNPVTTGTTISSTWANNTLSDIATALTQSIASDGQTTPTANLPMGGYKFTHVGNGAAATDSANYGQTYNQPAAASIASAATTNIGAAASSSVTITGTTTITAFDNVADGIKRDVTFSGALTLTHNATSLILPGGANITTVAGDCATFQSLGSGNWRCINYQSSAGSVSKAGDTMTGALTMSGAAINEAAFNAIASASTINIGAATSNTITVTGTTNITSLGTANEGIVRRLRFNGILTLTFNATSLQLPTLASITTASGDTAEFISLGSGNWKCVWYQRADGTPLAVHPGAVTLTTAQTISGVKTFSAGAEPVAKNTAKAWVSFNCSTGAIETSYGVSGVSRVSAGIYDITLSSAQSSSSYPFNISWLANTSFYGVTVFATSRAVSSMRIQAFTSAGVAIDPSSMTLVIFSA